MNLYNILNTLQLHHKKTTHSARMRTDNHESLSTILLHPIFHLLIMEKLELVSKPFDVHCKSQQTMLKPKPLEKHRFISSTILEDLSDFFFHLSNNTICILNLFQYYLIFQNISRVCFCFWYMFVF